MVLILSIAIVFYLINSPKKNEAKIVSIKKDVSIKKVDQNEFENKEFSIFIKAREETWLRVKMDDNSYFDIILKRGNTFLRKGKKLNLIIGNAGGIDLFINEEFIGNLGKEGEVVNISLPKEPS